MNSEMGPYPACPVAVHVPDYEMHTYKPMLTPPMSGSEGSQSPQSYTVLPTKEQYSLFGIGNITLQDETFFGYKDRPYLEIKEQPVDKFRFRYKSEMAGTHGSLSGMNSEKNRRQSFPTVQLHNYTGKAVVRCALYSVNPNMLDNELIPHAHRLVQKEGNTEVDDPHDKVVTITPEHNTIVFNNMGIIHTAKKFLVGEIEKKKKKLKQEEIKRLEGQARELYKAEEVEINKSAVEAAKTMNLNIVCLRFDAFEERNGIKHPLCEPVFSHGINNLKSALTGELKIVRMDRCTSPASGGKEIFLLVEKVTKKNIKVRFFENDDEDNEIWSGYGHFNDIDVHHQYAIVIRTPPYSNPITEDKKVFIELERPSDGAKSMQLDFTYYPDRTNKRKRPNPTYTSSSSYSSGDIPYLPELVSVNNPLPSEELCRLAKMCDSDEFDKFVMSSPDLINAFAIADQNDIRTDTSKAIKFESGETITPPIRIQPKQPKALISLPNKTPHSLIRTSSMELEAFLKTNNSRDHRCKMILENQMNQIVSKEGDSVLHLAVVQYEKMKEAKEYVDKMLVLLREHGLYDLLKMRNRQWQSLLHLAVEHEQFDIMDRLCRVPGMSKLKDEAGNTALHLAVQNERTAMRCEKLLLGPDVKEFVDLDNNSGFTALQLAVKNNKFNAVKALFNAGACVDVLDKHTGNNLLHLAIDAGHPKMVKFLLDKTRIDILRENYQSLTCQQMAKSSASTDDQVSMEILTMIEDRLKELGLFRECCIKEEPDSESEDMVIDETFKDDIKKEEVFSIERLKDLYENVSSFSSECLERLTTLLEDGSKWQQLAARLDFQFLLATDMFTNCPNPLVKLLDYALANGISIYQIRMCLDQMEEYEAANQIDGMVIRSS